MTIHLLDHGWWSRCSRRLHPSRMTTDLTQVTCRQCLARA